MTTTLRFHGLILALLSTASGCVPDCSCSSPVATPRQSTTTASAPKTAPPGRSTDKESGAAMPPTSEPAPTEAQPSAALTDASAPPTAVESALAVGPTLEDPADTAAVPEISAPGTQPITGASGPTPAPASRPSDPTAIDFFPDIKTASAQPALKAARSRQSAQAAARPPAAPAVLAALLPARIGKLEPAAPVVQRIPAGDTSVSVAARLYRRDGREIYIKISDTNEAPFMRAPVLDALGQLGNASQGFGHGRIIAGHPAVARYYPQQLSSQVTALVHDRYVIDVRILGASGPYEATKVLEALPLASLPQR